MAFAHSERTAAAKRRLREKFRRRRVNLFRKADQLSKIADALVYVVVVRNDLCYIYNSAGKDSKPPTLAKKFQRIERKGPQDYHEKQSEVDDEDLGDLGFNSPYQDDEDDEPLNFASSFNTAPYGNIQDEPLAMDLDSLHFNKVATFQQPQVVETTKMDLASTRLDGASTEYLSGSPLGVLQDDPNEHVDSLTLRPSFSVPSPDIAEVINLGVDLARGGQVDDDDVEQIKTVITPTIARHRSKRRGHLHNWTLLSPPILACF